MKTIKPKYLLGTITVFLLWTCLLQAQTLKLEIGLSKTTYLQGEPIWLDVTLTNITQDTARTWGLCFPCGLGFEVIVIDEKGDTLEYTGPLYDFIPGPGFIVKPGETYYDCLNLNEYFGKPQGLTGPLPAFTKSLNTSKYIVDARYLTTSRSVISDESKLEIKQPLGEEKKAYQLLEEAYDFFLQKKRDLMKEKLNEIITSYPKSVYAENACKELVLRDGLIEKFPNSGFTKITLRVLTSRMTEEKKREFLQKVIKDHPGTRSAKFAEQMLRGW